MIELETARWVIELILVGLAVVLWFLMRKLIVDVENLGKALAEYKLHVAEKYVTQDGMTKAFDSIGIQIAEVFRKLERIDDKLDKKADK
jgi:hypothetical protein